MNRAGALFVTPLQLQYDHETGCSIHDHIVRTELNRREDQNKARIGQKHSASLNIFIIKGINVITIQYKYIVFKVL